MSHSQAQRPDRSTAPAAQQAPGGPASGDEGAPAPESGTRAPTGGPGRPRRQATGPEMLGLPVTNLVILEVGLAAGLVVLAVDDTLLPAAIAVLAVAAVAALARWRGRWFLQWCSLTVGYYFRGHERTVQHSTSTGAEDSAAVEGSVSAGEDPRVSLLRLLVPDLVVASGTDHERRSVGLAWHERRWTAVLAVEAAPSLVTQVGTSPSLPLSALAPCLEDRGVVLDSIQAIWHCYPGSTVLPPDSPALRSYLEVLGPLPAAARRTTWIAVRLDPSVCAQAVAERGGGVTGAHRALLGALARVRGALESHGVRTRPLDADELLRAGITSAELATAAGTPAAKVTLRERWTGVTAAGVGHASYAITGWPARGMTHSLNALTGVRTLSSTVAVTIAPSEEDDQVAVSGLVRVSARTPAELAGADGRIKTLGNRLGLNMTPLRGLQTAAMAASLPVGGTL